MSTAALEKALEQIANGEKYINLNWKTIGTVELQRLVDVLPGSSVTSIDLGSNPITDTSVELLAGILPRTNIKTLYLHGTLITDAGAEALITALPDSRVSELLLPETVDARMRPTFEPILENNKTKRILELYDMLAHPPEPAAAPTTTVNTAEIIERQRRAALEDGQGI